MKATFSGRKPSSRRAANCARGGIVAEHLDAAGRRPDEAEHQLHQRRLAGAVVSDERHGLALLEIERGCAHGVDLAEALRDLPDPIVAALMAVVPRRSSGARAAP